MNDSKSKHLLFKTVICTEHLAKVRDGRFIEVIDAKSAPDGCKHYMLNNGWTESEREESPCEGAYDIEKTYYKRKKSKCTGVVVGFKDVVITGYLGVDTEYHCDGSEYQRVFKQAKDVVPCAIVYYADNKKHYVPLDAITADKPRSKRMTVIKIINPDILERVSKNNGYCPCAVVKDKDTLCMCKDFREAEVGTTCGCGLYRKEESE